MVGLIRTVQLLYRHNESTLRAERGNTDVLVGRPYFDDSVQKLALLQQRGEADGFNLIDLNDREEKVTEGLCSNVLKQPLDDPPACLDKLKQL